MSNLEVNRRRFFGIGASLASEVVFSETDNGVRKLFLDFFRKNKEGLLFGKPIMDVILDEEGRAVQYFENARLEHHPEYRDTKYEVQLGLLGEEVISEGLRKIGDEPFNREFYEKHGGRDFFGEVISEPFVEGNTAYQFTERFLLVKKEPEVPVRFRRSYELYKENREKLSRLLWPGEIAVMGLGRMVAGLRRIGAVSEFGFVPVKSDKRIEVDIQNQRLIAYEGEFEVFNCQVASGAPGFDTPKGDFKVLQKIETMPYRAPDYIRAAGRNYYLEAVPFNMQIVGDVLMHGAYWHDSFGTRRSAGCINLNLDDAWWLYTWSDVGTKVLVR